jgi:hypothetical protein
VSDELRAYRVKRITEHRAIIVATSSEAAELAVHLLDDVDMAEQEEETFTEELCELDADVIRKYAENALVFDVNGCGVALSEIPPALLVSEDEPTPPATTGATT